MAVIGIDLGTTNSLAAYWKDGAAQFIPNGSGEYLTPSVVSYVEDKQKTVVGKLAKERLLTQEMNTRASFKRFMGTEKEFYLGGKKYLAYELSAMVLKKIKQDAEQYLGEPIEEAIVTVPAYFNDRQRSDTKKAARLAGFSVKRLINEPSAAALAYRMKYQKKDVSLLVFDFGGGTLDISLVECFEEVVEIVGVAGDNYLGGDDIDLCMAQWFCEQVHWEYGELDRKEQQVLLKSCEQAKLAFSKQQQVIISVGEEQAELTAEKLFEICMPLFSRIKTVFLRVLRDCGYCISDIDDLIMVGGSSGLFVVQDFLKQLLGKAPVLLDKPEYVVAAGAGVYAGIRARKADICDMVLTDVCPFTLGVGSVNDAVDKQEHMTPIIERNSTLPAKGHVRVYSVIDYQYNMRIRIYQGEEYQTKENLLLGELSLALPSKPAGEAYVDIYFMYDLNGILQAEAVNEKGQKQKLLLSNKDLTQEELQENLEKMQQMIFTEERQLEIQLLRERAAAYYEAAVGVRREYMAGLLGWFEREIASGKQYRQRQAVRAMEQRLMELMQAEEQSEEYLLDGAEMLEFTEKGEEQSEE